MIIGIGTDLIEVSRVKKAMKSERFLQRIYTKNEQVMFEKKSWNPQTVAVNFAAKEAVAKALGTGFGKVSWTDIEILRDQQGKPVVNLYGEAEQLRQALNVINVNISLTHLKDLASATAILES